MWNQFVNAWSAYVGRPRFRGGNEAVVKAAPWIPAAGAVLGTAAGLAALLFIQMARGNAAAAGLLAAILVPGGLWWAQRGAGLNALVRAIRIAVQRFLDPEDVEGSLYWGITATQAVLAVKIIATGLVVANGGGLWLAVAPLIGAATYAHLLADAAGFQREATGEEKRMEIPVNWWIWGGAAVGVLVWTGLMQAPVSGVIALLLCALAVRPMAQFAENAGLAPAVRLRAVAEVNELVALLAGLFLTLLSAS